MNSDNSHHQAPSLRSRTVKFLWDLGWTASIVGIWPRFIEPELLSVTSLPLAIKDLPQPLEGLKIAQFSDLHLHPGVSDRFLNKLWNKISSWKPDLIVFTGDYLCYSKMTDEKRLKTFLQRFQAPLGCYAIFGNHDYQSYVAVNREGDYDIIEKVPSEIWKGLQRLFRRQVVKGKMSPRLTSRLVPSRDLVRLLRDTPFQPIENETVLLKIGDSALNLCGVGEYMANRFLPAQAFQHYDNRFPGLILAHNPDCIPHLESYPGDVVLCGHVHGGQVNLPWLRNRFVILENPQYVKGLHRVKDKWVYINRGLGGTMRFRLFSVPEVTLITLGKEKS
ncbi:MAG: UDP-2,3-diacylglucosamine diphosphatase LpxG [Nitrosomonas sp.]|nr:MAG: UDP-2,3-diacylglucosamine diphosphatase LpxG [Nitrosomonas sp.]